MAKCSDHYAKVLDGDPEFMKLVRETRFKARSNHLMAVDDAMLSIVTESENDQARVRAGQVIYDRFDPEYKNKVSADLNVSFVDLIRRAESE